MQQKHPSETSIEKWILIKSVLSLTDFKRWARGKIEQDKSKRANETSAKFRIRLTEVWYTNINYFLLSFLYVGIYAKCNRTKNDTKHIEKVSGSKQKF